MSNTKICRQAYARVIDQCLTVQGLNLTDFYMVLSLSNDSVVNMPLLNRLVNTLCGGSACRDSIQNAFRACYPGISVSAHYIYIHVCPCMCV